MEPKDIVPIVGWIVVFFLGILSGGVIVPYLAKKRKVFAWATLSENEIVPKELSKRLGIPVVLQVGPETPASLTTCHLRFGSGGNEVIENLRFSVTFNKGGKILNVRALDDLGEYGKHVSWSHDGDSCTMQLEFLNPETTFDMEFLISNYELRAGLKNLHRTISGVSA